MLEVSNIYKSFGSNAVLRGASFTIPPESLIGLIGPSGSGKSVLLKIISGILSPDSGEIIGADKDMSSTRVGFLFQEGALFDSMTVLENVTFPLLEGFPHQDSSHDVEYDQAVERAYELLCAVGLGAAFKKVPGQLSGGMKRRLALARALVHNPELVLLDDPVAGLDPVAASVIMELISELYQERKPTMIICSHDLRRLIPNVDRVVSLFNGRVVGDCASEELQHSSTDEVRGFVETRYEFS